MTNFKIKKYLSEDLTIETYTYSDLDEVLQLQIKQGDLDELKACGYSKLFDYLFLHLHEFKQLLLIRYKGVLVAILGNHDDCLVFTTSELNDTLRYNLLKYFKLCSSYLLYLNGLHTITISVKKDYEDGIKIAEHLTKEKSSIVSEYFINYVFNQDMKQIRDNVSKLYKVSDKIQRRVQCGS